MIRTFLAVELSEALRANLSSLQRELKQQVGREGSKHVRLSWVQPTSIHLTVKFLGDIDEELVKPMQEAIAQVVAGQRAIKIPLERLGVFPRLQQPRVLWIGPSEGWERGEGAGRLLSLHQSVESCCASLNLARDSRPLSPHLTLARIKEGERQVGQILAERGVMDRPLNLGTMEVNAIVLMKSELKPTGSVYTKLWEVRIGE